MKRTTTTTNEQDETPLPPHGQAPSTDPANDRMPCRKCGEETTRAALSLFGAQCKACYDAYARGALAPRPPTYDTQAQRDMRRRRLHLGGDDE